MPRKASSVSSVFSSYTYSKSLWDYLMQLGLPSKRSQSTYSTELNIDGEILFDHRKVADKFNTFYTTVAAELAKKKKKNFLNV